jgi:hypothetical protein
MGVCEITSYLTLNTIKKLISSGKIDKNNKYTFIVLAGAADMFIDGCFYKELCTDNLPEGFKKEISNKPSLIRWLFKLKIYKLASTALTQLMNQYGSSNAEKEVQIASNEQNYDIDKIFTDVTNCWQSKSEDLSWSCIRNIYSQQTHPKGQHLVFIKTLSLILKDSDYTAKTAPQVVERLLKVKTIDYKFTLTATYIINMLRHLQLQSIYSPELIYNDIRESYKKVQAEESNKLANVLYKDDGLKPVMDNFAQWMKNVKEDRRFTKKYFTNIISTIQEHKNIDLILLTYPLPYTHINNLIRKLGKKFHITVIDLEKTFKPLFKKMGKKSILTTGSTVLLKDMR